METFETIAGGRSVQGVRFLNKELPKWPKLLVPHNYMMHRNSLFGAGPVSHFRISMASTDICLVATLGVVLAVGKGERISYQQYSEAFREQRKNRYKDGVEALGMTLDQAIAFGFQINLDQDPRTGYGTLNKIWWPKIREAVATAFE